MGSKFRLLALRIIRLFANRILKKYLHHKLYKIMELTSIYIFYTLVNFNKPVGSFLTLKFLVFIIFNNRKTWYAKSLDIKVVANIYIFGILLEVYNKQLYASLENLKLVLDVGAYIGESSVFLANRNQQVVAFEPSIEKFELLKKNIRENIIAYNVALTTQKEEKIDFFYTDDFDYASSHLGSENDKVVQVNSVHIKDILKKYSPDGLKMDIEGGEFEILNFCLSKGKDFFPFKKGIIEFHFDLLVSERLDFFKRFLKYLSNYNYGYRIFDNSNETVDIDILIKKIESGKTHLANLEFFEN